MIELFQMGGVLYMSILSILLLGVVIASVRSWTKKDTNKKDEDLVRSIGLLACITGIFGQLTGLFQAFGIIEEVGAISPALLVGGIKVSMITTIYGLLIYMISLVLTLVIKKMKQ